MDAKLLSSSVYPNSTSSRLKHPYLHSNSHVCLRLDILRATGPATNNGSEGAELDTSANLDDTAPSDTSQPRPRPATLNIKYRSRNKARRQQQLQSIKKPPPKKDWESMTVGEKAMELYMGEKGLLFWLNKFAYASIFIVIGGWILFRFVGPSLGLYQLESEAPLNPSDIFKGSP